MIEKTELFRTDYLSGLGRLHRLAEELTNARKSLDSAVPSLAFKMNLFTTGNPVEKAKDELLALGGTVTTIEYLLTALHDCPRKASALLERVFELQNRLDDLQRKSLQLEVRGESAGDSLMQLAGLLIEYTSTLGALYRELDQQVGQYKNLAEQLPIGWPLKAHLQQWLQGKAEAVADLQQHKNLALLLGRLANPSAGSDVQAYAHTRLAGMVSTLPSSSPYLQLLAKHPNEQVRGLVPALVPEPATTNDQASAAQPSSVPPQPTAAQTSAAQTSAAQTSAAPPQRPAPAGHGGATQAQSDSGGGGSNLDELLLAHGADPEAIAWFRKAGEYSPPNAPAGQGGATQAQSDSGGGGSNLDELLLAHGADPEAIAWFRKAGEYSPPNLHQWSHF